ncbi:metallophosphoesterase [Flavobacterium psychraquaticum]|uniref:metallophosphoesterase n=1 Tax=Flavobacterium psychraquaticum TaxID=3103958 RepID=UPI002ACE4D85|nr:metallophosphoesterase [Flavobacterium sp. LB-N7T]
MLRILHLTDFHFSNKPKDKLDQKRLVDSLKRSLENDVEEIDLIFFTGDLVNSGSDYNDFIEARELLLDSLSDFLKINKENIFICAGNHDVNRNQELDDVRESIAKIKDNKGLDEYVLKQEGKSLKASLENHVNYLKFQKDFYSYSEQDIIEPLYTNHFREIKKAKINITTINSAWRAIDSNTDSGNLLFPIHFLKEVNEKKNDNCLLNIMLMHHPLSDFKYWNYQAMEDVIFKSYHMMFSGHSHKNRDTIHVVPEIGMYSCTSPAALSNDGKSRIGYSIVEVDLNDYSLRIFNKVYQSDDEVFYVSETPLTGQIPMSEKKQNENKFRRTIRKRFNEELEKANELFLSYTDKDYSNFIEMFTEPVIKSGSKTNIRENKVDSVFTIDELINSKMNEILFGRDKSGKTAILYKVFLDILNDFSSLEILSIYIDCKEIVKSQRKLNLLKKIQNFYELNNSDAEGLSKKYHFKILLDNFEGNEQYVLNPLNEFMEKNPNCSIIATSEETLLNSFAGKTINNTCFNNKFIWDIGRKQIRTLTNKWPGINDDNKEILLEKIHKVFNQLNIPSNYWTVSLFIWIFEKNADANIKNNFQLIESYIDNLLDKENFILNESIYKIDYEDFKIYLGELAYHLIKEYNSENYVIPYSELISFTSNYKKHNRKFVIDVENIVRIIIDKGVLKKAHTDSYTFRLNGVFEYFLAYYMKDNEEFRDEIIKDGHYYLSFGNEFEICAGFISREKSFVEKIFERTKDIFKELNSTYNLDQVDFHLQNIIQEKLNVDLKLPEILKDRIKPISIENQDVLFEEVSNGLNDRMSGIQTKKYYEHIESNSENLEKALFILSRVFRNSKLKDNKLEDEVFDFILNSSCTLGFQLVEEIEENKFDYLSEKTNEHELMRLLTKFIPLVVQTFFYDALVQNNLENILKEKIEKLKIDSKNNQFKLLVLYFSLIDLNLKQNHHYINEIISVLSLGVLKNTSLIKLYMYLALKVNGNKSLEDKIKGYIKEQEYKLNSSKNQGEIDQKISKVSKLKPKK